MHARPAQTAIVGAGIAGLTTAAALNQTGLSCRVFEQVKDLRALGAGLQLSPNAVRVLQSLGLGPDLQREAVAVESIRFLRWSDSAPLASLPLGRRGIEAFGAPYYTIHRADLHRVLRSRLADDVLELDAEVIEVREESDRARVHLSDGRSVDADVVIGADGIHSRVRTGLAHDAPRYTGHVIYRGLVERDRLPGFEVPQVRLWMGPGQHVISYPICAGRIVYFGATATVQDWPSACWSVPAEPAELADSYRGWSDEIQALIAAARDITCWALYDRAPLLQWGGPCSTLIGDAAHSMLPFMAQGANQAIEDAIVLAMCLRDGCDSSALRRYESIRKPRVERIHALSRANADLFHLASGPSQESRDRTFEQFWTLSNLDWLYGHDAIRRTRWKDAS